MPREFRLPDIGEGISEAIVLEWHVDVGDVVSEGQAVADISTDKVDVELPAPAAGRIVAREAEVGDTVKVGATLLVLETGADDVGDRGGRSGSHGAPGAAAPADPPLPAGLPSAGPPAVAPAARHAPAVSYDGERRVIASPFARRYAAEHGIDVERLVGSGPRGRVVQADVEAALAAESVPDAASAAGEGGAEGGVRREPLDRVRAVMAERMAASAHTLATSTTTFAVDASGLQALLAGLREDAEAAGVKLTPLALVACCTAAALRRHARFNATIDERARELLLHDDVNLGIAAATERGLVVPVLRAVNRRSLLALAGELGELVRRAREERLDPADVRGATFTLSSTGALERATVVATQPIVNAPQTATMWCSRIAPRPWVDGDGALVARPVLTCSLSFDHRFVDGAEATAFINDLVRFLERPERALATLG